MKSVAATYAAKWQKIDDFYHLMALPFEIYNRAINL